MNIKYDKKLYISIIIIVIFLGLLSRKLTDYLPNIINLFLGDSLWAMMIFFFCKLFWENWKLKKVGLTSLTFCFIIELSQLYQANWINVIRKTTLGWLILWRGFLWSDLLAYTIGISLGIIIDIFIQKNIIQKGVY